MVNSHEHGGSSQLQGGFGGGVVNIGGGTVSELIFDSKEVTKRTSVTKRKL